MFTDSLYLTYGEDSLRWFEQYQASEQPLETIQADIIAKEDAAMAFFFAETYTHNNHLMQRVVLESGNLLYCLLFARHISNADIKALQTAILKQKPSDDRLRALCEFARYVKGADTLKLEKVLLKDAANNPFFVHYFVKHIPGASLESFKPILLNSGKPRYLYWLAQQNPTPQELAKIENLLITAKSFQYIRLLAENIPKTNIAKLEQFVLESGNTKEIKKFAKSVKTAKSKGLALFF